jgi:cell division septal protein FtsQ
MAVNLNPPFKQKINPILSYLYFRRNSEEEQSNRIKRKIKVRPAHVMISFLLIFGFFFLLQQTYLFLITWSRLEVDKIEIYCTKPELKNFTQNLFNGKKLGNLLLLDIKSIQKTIKSQPWVKEVRIKKIFPSALNIDIKERVPAAIIKKDQYFLIDENGISLQPVNPTEKIHFPVLTDESEFKSKAEDKLELALTCLKSLPPEQRILIKTMDLSKYKCVSIKLKQDSPWLILGHNDFPQKIQDYLNKKSYFNKFGELKSINMRFKDRYILTPGNKKSDNRIFMSEKEEH